MPKITTASSKQDEIDALNKFRASVGAGTYLDSLLTPGFMKYVECMIANDQSCDIWADNVAHNERFYKVDSERRLAETKLRGVEANRLSTVRDLHEAESNLKLALQKIAQLQAQIDRAKAFLNNAD